MDELLELHKAKKQIQELQEENRAIKQRILANETGQHETRDKIISIVAGFTVRMMIYTLLLLPMSFTWPERLCLAALLIFVFSKDRKDE